MRSLSSGFSPVLELLAQRGCQGGQTLSAEMWNAEGRLASSLTARARIAHYVQSFCGKAAFSQYRRCAIVRRSCAVSSSVTAWTQTPSSLMTRRLWRVAW